MEKNVKHHFQNIIFPCVVFSGITGILTGLLVFAFRVVSEKVIEWSHHLYELAGSNPAFIPLMVGIAVVAALLVSLSLIYSPHSRGGGIPTAVALMRGLITFSWLRNLIFVFTSALLSYLCGIPLGNDEGPAVQMGTAIGSGTCRLFAKKHRAWERYLMTSGATAGFATATGAPVTAVLFGLEEGHRRFSPLLIMSSASSVLCGMGVLEVLCNFAGIRSALFHFTVSTSLPLSDLWIALPVGLLCGGFAYLLGLFTHHLRHLLHKTLKNVHPFFKVAPVFAVVAIIGCLYYEAIGTGHHLIETLLAHRLAWYSALALLAIRSVLVVLSNDVGATGGLFTPILSFGALIGSVTAEAMIALGVMQETHFMLIVVIGMTSFFAAAVRTPLTAIVFSIELLSGFGNILPILLAVVVSYVMVEVLQAASINEIAMERDIHRENRGKVRHSYDISVDVMPGSFAVGKEPRDILWPASCVVLSMNIDPTNERNYGGGPIREHNILRLNFSTYDPERTERELCAILGDQVLYDDDVIRHDIFIDKVEY
ncbi:MAG: chloride channel protein [Clostridia bacterium]|nr:chloride channel protein [Clostridia bacterium]